MQRSNIGRTRISARRLGAGLFAVLLGTLASCASSSSSRDMQAAENYEHWVPASPVLQQQINDEIARLPWTHGFERLEQIRWFASIGEPAFDSLLDLALDPRDDVAAAALASLGATLDHRLVPYIHELQWTEQRVKGDLGLERARTLLRLGDWSEIPALIRGLRDERLYTRSLCFEALQEATHESLDFEPRADEATREAGAKRWELWWTSRSTDGFLP